MANIIDLSAAQERRDLAPTSETSALIQVIERAARDPNVDIVKLKELFAMRKEIAAEAAETAFNEALSAAQSEMAPISADATNPQTHSKYASYAKLDRVLRPIYVKHGFSISFDEKDSPKADHVRVLAYVSRSGHTRTYQKDMPADGKGAKGGDVMTKTHAAAAAQTYGMRYLLKGIFNVAVGEDDTDGNEGGPEPLVTEKQIADLNALISEVGADRTRFLKYIKVSSVRDIMAKDYAEAVKLLQSKRAQ